MRAKPKLVVILDAERRSNLKQPEVSNREVLAFFSEVDAILKARAH